MSALTRPYGRLYGCIHRLARLLALGAAFCLSMPPTFAQTPTTARVSVATNGTQGNNDSSIPSISADGRYVAFVSYSSNLVPGDTNQSYDIFVRDTVAGTTKIISVATNGTQGNGDSFGPSISADGRYVAFVSYASNLVPGDTNRSRDVFVRDTVAGTTQRVSLASDGTQGNGDCLNMSSISADGRYVAFYSYASNLVPSDTNGKGDAFIRDTVTGTIQRVSVATDGTQTNGESAYPKMSSDGRYVAFQSGASNLAPGDTNGTWDIFLRDTVAGTTKMVSIATEGTHGNDQSVTPSLSADGRYVAFISKASNLVAGDTNGWADIYVRDTVAETTTRVSLASDGTQGNGGSYEPAISADGRYVVFYSYASNLVPGDTNGKADHFVRDTAAGTTQRVSLASDGTQGNGDSLNMSSISADGRYVAFQSAASNLVEGDTNNGNDIFLRGPLPTTYTAPATLVFATQPGLAEAGKPFQVQPVVLARDAGNVLITTYNGPITLALKAGTGTTGAAMTGTATVLAVNGMATFTDLGLDRKGAEYVLEAFVGPNDLGESAAFNVTPKAERLVFTAQPGGATDDWPLASQPIARVVDADGETATLNRAVVSLAIKPGTGAPGAALSGTSSATALHGVAGFTGLNIDRAGAGYKLTASSPSLISVDSIAFDVLEAPKLVLRQSAPDEIEVSVHPVGATIIGATIALSWKASELAPVVPADIHPAAGWTLDSTGTTSGLTATLLHPGTGVNGPVLTLQLSAQPGFTGYKAIVTLTAASDLTDDGYTPIPVAAKSLSFIPHGGHLAFTRQPVLTTAGNVIAGQPTVALLDGTGAVVADFTDPVTMAIKPGTGAAGAVLGGTTQVSAAAGVTAFNGLTIDRKGTGYVLVASNGPFVAESLAFDIAPRAQRLTFTTQPGNARAGLPLTPQPVIAVQDDESATALAFSGPVTLAIKPGTGFPGATLSGTATLNAVAGIATFIEVRIGTAAPGYVFAASGQSLTGAESAAFNVTPFTFTTVDIGDSLRWAAGMSSVPPGYLPRYDVVTNGRVDLRDAVRITRKAAGLEANP